MYARLVFTRDGVGFGVVVEIDQERLNDFTYVENPSHKWSHKLDGGGIGKISTVPFFFRIHLLYVVACDPVKTRLLESKGDAEEQTNCNAGSEAVIMVFSCVSVYDPDERAFIDHKRWSYKRNQYSVSDSVGLIFIRSLCSCTCDYESDSVASDYPYKANIPASRCKLFYCCELLAGLHLKLLKC